MCTLHVVEMALRSRKMPTPKALAMFSTLDLLSSFVTNYEQATCS
jgi:hypothetical protein